MSARVFMLLVARFAGRPLNSAIRNLRTTVQQKHTMDEKHDPSATIEGATKSADPSAILNGRRESAGPNILAARIHTLEIAETQNSDHAESELADTRIKLPPMLVRALL
ncbi:hypothetical protein HOY80DRAFT_1134565 [Tuber brumale]|nr:hypothetical protein HOY80DRAFT_1134565 [Tuber brumale]